MTLQLRDVVTLSIRPQFGLASAPLVTLAELLAGFGSVVTPAFFGNVRAIGAGAAHTTSVRNDGTVWNWGVGSQGQLGDGTSGNSLDVMRAVTPLQVQGIDGVESVEDSNSFVLALKSNGTVWGWGTCTVKVVAHNLTSNAGAIRISQ